MGKIKKLFNNKKVKEILFVFFLSLTPVLWFRKDEIIVGHDNVFPLNPIIFLQGRLSTWIEHGFGQSQDLIMGTIPIHLIDAIPYLFGLSIQKTEIAVYIFWFFAMGLSMYIFASQFRSQSFVFRLLAVILYQFNFFLLQGWWIGERTKFSAYVAFPLILTIFLKVRRGEMSLFKAIILNCLIFFVFNAGGLYGVPLYGGMFIALLVFLIFFGLFDLIEKNFVFIRRVIFLTVFSIIGYVLINAYFTFPLAMRLTEEYSEGVARVGGVEGLLDWTRVISANASYINLLRLEGIAEWYDNPEHPYSSVFLKNPLFIIGSFVWPVLIILALKRRYSPEIQKFIVFLFLVFLIGIFLSSGSHRPFGIIYEILMQYIPGFAAFRSPYYKFASAIFFAASLLIAFYIDSFRGKRKYLLFLLTVIFVFLFHFPFFTGNIFSWREGFSTRLTPPSYLIEFGNWLEKEKKDDGRILFLPPNSPGSRYSLYDWGYLSFQALPTLFSNKSTIINNDRLNDDERKLVDTLYNSFSDGNEKSIQQFASYLGVKYILIQEDTIPDDVRSSFSLLSDTYKKTIEEKLNLPLIKKFGRWSLYEMNSEELPIFYALNNMSLVSGPVNNFSYYYDFLEDKNAFIKNDDVQKLDKNTSRLPDIYSLTCIKCKKKDRPFIIFPKLNTLPNSPFYPFILLDEKRRLNANSPRSLVYDYLGLSVKRLSEIVEMIEKDMVVPDEVLNRYVQTIQSVQINFDQLSRLEDKYSSAEDLSFYIQSQRDFINETLGNEVSGSPAVVLDQALAALRLLELKIQPYIFILDITQNRFYGVNIAKKDVYGFYVRSKEFNSIIKENAHITVNLDGKEVKTLPLKEDSFQNDWFHLGDFSIDQGDHTLLFSFSELENKILPLKPAVTVMNDDGRRRCFTTQVQNYDNRKRYKAVVRYRNELFEDINVYVWEEKEEGRNLRFASKLIQSFSEEEFTHEIDPQSDIKGIHLGFCSASITEDFVNERFIIKVSELIEPVVLLQSQKNQTPILSSVSFGKISPAKYSVSFSSENPNSILVFNSRFDDNWELEEFSQNHVPVNGFANGWIIDKPGKYSLTLLYKPQNTFYFGGFVSFAIVTGGILYLVFEKFIKRRKIE